MNIDPTFPDDWIMPNEFPVCISCGLLIIRGQMLCYCCRFASLYDETPGYPVLTAQTIENARENDLKAHDELVQDCKAVAASRRRSGWKPLFWLLARSDFRGEIKHGSRI